MDFRRELAFVDVPAAAERAPEEHGDWGRFIGHLRRSYTGRCTFIPMTKRLELMVRLVDGSQLYWDASVRVEPLTVEEIDALRPKTAAERMDFDVRRALHEKVREKFREAADDLWRRALTRIG